MKKRYFEILAEIEELEIQLYDNLLDFEVQEINESIQLLNEELTILNKQL